MNGPGLQQLWGETPRHYSHHRSHRTLQLEHKRLANKHQSLSRYHKHIGFERLAHRVEREYLRKGYSLKRAREWGRATAAKVYRERGHRR